MGTLEERVAFLEGRVVEHSQMVDGIREAIVSLEQRMDRRFDAMDGRFDATDRRFDAIDRRFDAIDRRFEGGDRRVEGLEQKVDRQFRWLVGIHMTTLVAMVAALLAR